VPLAWKLPCLWESGMMHPVHKPSYGDNIHQMVMSKINGNTLMNPYISQSLYLGYRGVA